MESMNDQNTQRSIAELLEGCRTPKGGFTRRFFKCFNECFNPPINEGSWTPPPGWYKRVMQGAVLGEVREAADAYHAGDGDVGFFPVPAATKPTLPPVAPEPTEHGSVIGRMQRRLDDLEARVSELERLRLAPRQT